MIDFTASIRAFRRLDKLNTYWTACKSPMVLCSFMVFVTMRFNLWTAQLSVLWDRRLGEALARAAHAALFLMFAEQPSTGSLTTTTVPRSARLAKAFKESAA